mgnify:CR=1 FL=1
MADSRALIFAKKVLENRPEAWEKLTTHRLDIYEEKLAKSQFLDALDKLYHADHAETAVLAQLPTAYDYIRLGHPLSCVLEWAVAHQIGLNPENVISFSSQVTPIFAILRKNLLTNKNTQILYKGALPAHFDEALIRQVYGYAFELRQVDNVLDISSFDGTTVLVSEAGNIVEAEELSDNIDFYIHCYPHLGSILWVNGQQNADYISEIQHVRRRETIAMTPANCVLALTSLVNHAPYVIPKRDAGTDKVRVLSAIKEITGSPTKALVGSSGLSVQYAIMMGLVHHAQENHAGKAIRFIVPPNCYGGTNDQARRVAACINNTEVVDLPVDGSYSMVQSLESVLTQMAHEDTVPYIIAEIPTNPRVEVPNLQQLQETLSKKRFTPSGNPAIDPVFILDQTFCPNVHFLGEGAVLSSVRAISYVSGSKFPSGGKCTAGYCVGNTHTETLIEKISLHLLLCDNEATEFQYELLAEQMPSMNQRIAEAYANTRAFVNFIKEVLSSAKINFVSESLAEQGFTPSVFSLDLPTKGQTPEARESYKRALNLKLINLMIGKIPHESTYCVSYGQLKGCYWTIPATSTQGTTKEGDKDYIARVALSPKMDLELHKKVFLEFVQEIAVVH